MKQRYREQKNPGLLILLIALGMTPVLSQTEPGSEEDLEELKAFQVTGSYISKFDTETTQPLTQISSEFIEEDGFSTSGEILSELSITGAAEFNESEDGPNDARGDVTSVNLRSLGSAYTLVLMNGRRLAPHPLNQTLDSTPSVLVNANVLPAGLIDRIDILRDGASALYGTDASAGVVNSILTTDDLGQSIRFRYGVTEQGSNEEYLLSYNGGFSFNDNKTYLGLFGSYFSRGIIRTGDRSYAAFGDKRPLVPEWFQGDTSIQNVSSSSIYSNLGTGDGARLRIDGDTLSNSSGQFHVEPPGSSGTRAIMPNGFGLDDGSLPRSERYDTVPLRTLTSEAERLNLFANFTHELNNQITLFGEAGYYYSETYMERAPSNISSSAAIFIPAENYYSPVGQATLPGGDPYPNRLTGVTVDDVPLPDAGIDLLLRNWRSEDFGQRLVTIENDSFVGTLGLRGNFMEDWYWESAVRYNRNEATDSETGRLSKTGFVEAASRQDPTALNVFAGGGANDPANFEDAAIVVERVGKTTLLSGDIRVNNPNLFSLLGNPSGIAFGLEAREETYEDDRDPRIDGTIRFDDTVNGASDVIGVSPTPDTASDRTVWGVYAETILPLFGEANRLPLFYRLDVQLAGRFEDYNDFGNVTKPKIAIAWYPYADLLIRGSYAEGFTAPNLSLLTEPIQRSNTGIEDEYRFPWDVLRNDQGEPVDEEGNVVTDIDDAARTPATDGTDPVSELRGGNEDLEPEESTTLTAGLAWRVPGLDGLTLSADFFHIEIKNIIRIDDTSTVLEQEAELGNQLAFDPSVQPGDSPQIADFVRRRPLLQSEIDNARLANVYAVGEIDLVFNRFQNRAFREISGWDFGFEYAFPENALGNFTLDGNATYMSTYKEQDEEGGPVNDDLLGDADRALPRFRGQLGLRWRNEQWRGAVSYRYISGLIEDDVVSDPDLDPSGEAQLWRVSPWKGVNLSGAYRFMDGFLEGSRISLGVRNLFNEDPPLNPDESYGYESNVHSNRGRFYYGEIRYDF